MDVRIKRAYAPASPEDGHRALVDRLWPRGVSKADAALDTWAKDAAPSAALRRAWHAADEPRSPAGFSAFTAAYRAELAAEPAASALADLADRARTHGTLTLVYGARDERVNHAIVLRDALRELLLG